MRHPLEALVSGEPRFDPADTPVEVAVVDGGREMRLSYADGSTAAVRAETLRLNCRCAWCTRARADDRFPAAFPGAALTAVNPMGGYAAHLVFADGHDRGIFPWTYARQLADATPALAPAEAA